MATHDLHSLFLGNDVLSMDDKRDETLMNNLLSATPKQ